MKWKVICPLKSLERPLQYSSQLNDGHYRVREPWSMENKLHHFLWQQFPDVNHSELKYLHHIHLKSHNPMSSFKKNVLMMGKYSDYQPYVCNYIYLHFSQITPSANLAPEKTNSTYPIFPQLKSSNLGNMLVNLIYTHSSAIMPFLQSGYRNSK